MPFRRVLWASAIAGSTYVCRGSCLAVFVPIRGQFTGDGLRLEVWSHGEGPIELERVE